MRISFEQACDLLNRGDVVAIPTETVYGLAALASCPSAVQQIFALKGRPANNPLIIHMARKESLGLYTQDLSPVVGALADAFWPGPLTLVLPINTGAVPSRVCAGMPTAAFRIPSHPLALRVLEECGPLVMPSANLSGRPSSTTFKHVEQDFGGSFPVLDGGPCRQGLESTILMEHEQRWIVVRQGAIPAEVFGPMLGYIPEIMHVEKGSKPLCPGQLYRHYAPKARLTLVKAVPEGYQGAVVGYGNRTYPSGCRVIPLGNSSDPQGVGENLYHVLRLLDEENIGSALVDVDFPSTGLWLTLAERLEKAKNK